MVMFFLQLSRDLPSDFITLLPERVRNAKPVSVGDVLFGYFKGLYFGAILKLYQLLLARRLVNLDIQQNQRKLQSQIFAERITMLFLHCSKLRASPGSSNSVTRRGSNGPETEHRSRIVWLLRPVWNTKPRTRMKGRIVSSILLFLKNRSHNVLI